MRAALFRLINRQIDRVTGFNIREALKRTLAFDQMSRDEIEHYQKEKFQKLGNIASHARFYSKQRGKSLQDWPLMTREGYAREFPGLETYQVKSYIRRRSTGSTGIPVTHCITREMLLAKRVSHQKMLAWHGLTRESSEMKLGGEPAKLKTRIYYVLRNKRYINSYRVSEQDIKRIVRKYNRFKPRVLYGYPSVINEFIRRAATAGRKLHQPDLIVTHAENLYLEIRETFEKHFPGVKIANQYWATEAPIAETCPDGKLHIAEDIVFCEVIDRDENGVGDLYITNLFSYTVPYIRYQLGDRIKLSKDLCTCGRNSKVIETIVGREAEYIELPDGRKYPVTAFHYSGYTENVLTYQLIYQKSQRKITMNYIPLRDDQPVMEKELRQYWKDHFGLKAEIRRVSRIEYSPGGKKKKFISKD